MANWLLDYIEMTEYIPPEFRDQTFQMRELDLKVSISMSQLDSHIKEFFSKIDILNAKKKQEEYDMILKKFNEASEAVNTKVKIADRLHDLVEKGMRLLDQGLEKLKEDLVEGDKAYIVEDIERRSRELDEQLRLAEEAMMHRHLKTSNSRASNHQHIKGSHINNNSKSNHQLLNPHANHLNHSAHSNHINYNHRPKHNSSGAQAPTTSTTSKANFKQKKREKKRTSAMTIFNRNSKPNDDSLEGTDFLSSPTAPTYISNLQGSGGNSLNNVSTGNSGCLTLKGMITGDRSATNPERFNGLDTFAKARQPILTAIDAVHAVSPNATNSDKLVLFSNKSNGDNSNNFNYTKDKHVFQNQLGQSKNNLISPFNFDSLDHGYPNNAIKTNREVEVSSTASTPFSGFARNDPIMMAASQAIHATQNMTFGRRTSSLKASYAAVNSGRLQHPNANQSVFDHANLTGEVYCKCRGTNHDTNMIACDNTNCKIEWFHYECVGITTPPAGEWYCDDCKGLPRTVQEQAANSSKRQLSRQAAAISNLQWDARLAK